MHSAASASHSGGAATAITINAAPSASQISHSASSGAAASGGGGAPVNNINIHPSHTINNHSATSMKDIHDTVVRVLTDSVSDHKIGTDIY